MATDDRPLITCAGNQSLFASVHPYMVDALPLQKIEWQRSYGRPVKKVRLCGHFIPFDVHQLPRKFDENRLLKEPILHLYWIDCDIDMYKRKVRDDVFMWLSALKALSIPDWLIIVVVHEENKVKSKILRTSVYDKVKSEFGSKSSNRCVIFSEPFKNDPKTEAWTTVISRIQELMLASFSRTISKFEDAMRMERERRTQSDWTFTKYFMLQESLAKFYNIIELYEDALVQYDELDALFAQFVVNHSVGAKADWLIPYSELSSGWEGVSMSTDVNLYRRMLISEGKPSLLDLRNYMFSRQCHLLIQLERPSELTDRSLKFIHNTIHELRLLEVVLPPGAVSCWVFLTCKELLTVCEAFKEYLDIEIYSIYTSHLWKCLQSVTHKLGCLGGLMPGSTPSSQELHSVVQLISGISNGAKSAGEPSPQHRLKRVLSSSEEFCSYYVELTEMTVCTLKYINHTRMAKILGLQLARFYMSSKKPQQAEPFLLNCLQLFTNDQWTSLEVDTWTQFADCEQMMGNNAAYLRACLKVASHSKAPPHLRTKYLQRITDFTLPDCEDPVVVVEDCALTVHSIDIKHDSKSNVATLWVQVDSSLPDQLEYDTLSLLIKPNDPGETTANKPKKARKGGSSFAAVQLTPYYDKQEEDGSISVGLACANTHSLLTLKDSQSTGHMIRNLSKNKVDLGEEEREMGAHLYSSSLQPGRSQLTFSLQEPLMGQFRVHQIRLKRSSMDLYSNLANCSFSIHNSDPPSVFIQKGDQPCFLGLSNSLMVHVTSTHLDKLPQVSSPHTNISVTNPDSSDGTMELRLNPFSDVTVTPASQILPVNFQFDSTPNYTLPADTLLISQTIECLCPIEISSKLFTAREQKFVQITVFSLEKGRQLHIKQPMLVMKEGGEDSDIQFSSMTGSEAMTWILEHNNQLSFLWKLETDVVVADSIRCSFSLHFQEKLDKQEEGHKFHTFNTDVNIDIIQTQFIMTRYIKSGIPMSPLSLSRRSSEEHILSSSPESLSLPPVQNTWQALCECEMVVELKSCNDLHPSDGTGQGHMQQISYEIRSDPNWAISGNKHGLLELNTETLLSGICVTLMPLTPGYLCMPEVRLRNANKEEFLPGQVYDNSKLSQVFISNPDN